MARIRLVRAACAGLATLGLTMFSVDDLLAQTGDAPRGEIIIDDRTDEAATYVATTKDAALKPAAKKKPAPYKPLFYDNDFGYLCDDPCASRYVGDGLKNMSIGPCVQLDVGGEYRLRHHHEDNFRGAGSALNGQDDEFLLQRTRVYGDLKLGGWFRAYAEAIDATSSHENFPARAIEENRFDALNLFADARLWDGADGTLTGRVGRQELLYGAQRLVSPLDWANTRRTFDGAKLFWQGEDWKVDGFWTRPVAAGKHLGNDHNFDRPDQSQEFMGVYASRQGGSGHSYDFYYLRLAEYDAPGGAANPADFDANTFGARWQGKRCHWLWEVEGAINSATSAPATFRPASSPSAAGANSRIFA